MTEHPTDESSGTGGLVTIRTYLNILEAQWAQALLTSAGICSSLPDGNSAVLFYAVGGIRLQVHRSEAEEAETVLSGREFERIFRDPDRTEPREETRSGGPEEEEEAVETVGPEDVCPFAPRPACPDCGSDKLEEIDPPPYAGENRLAATLSRALGHGWVRCVSCGREFQE